MKKVLTAICVIVVAHAAHAALINDGTMTGMVSMTTTNIPTTTWSSSGGVLTFDKVGTGGESPKTVLYDNDTGDTPSGNQYTVSGEFVAQVNGTFSRGGVSGWLDTSNGEAISIYARGSADEFRVRTHDFNADDSSNETYNGLYELNGSAMTNGNFSSTGYVWNQWVTLELDFQAPTAADISALGSVTARIVATWTQGANSGSKTFLTNLAQPADGNHRVGYYAQGSGQALTGDVGDFDNLDLTVIPEPGSFALMAIGGIMLLLRRRKS